MGKRKETSVGVVADWRKQKGHLWEIPYESLLPKKITGLVTAGRCISSANDAWEVTRVIPAAAFTGEIAGIAAALSVQRNTVPSSLDAADIQKIRREKGMPLHSDEIDA
jgi:hypothetical protein